MKDWKKPELVVLSRGKPEEMVLTTGCKHPLLQGPSSSNNICGGIPSPSACGACQANDNKS